MVVNANELKEGLGERSLANLERKIDGFLVKNSHKSTMDLKLDERDIAGLSSEDVFNLMAKYRKEEWDVQLKYQACFYTKREDISTWQGPHLQFSYKWSAPSSYEQND